MSFSSGIGGGLSAAGDLLGAFGSFQAGNAKAAADAATAKGYAGEAQAYNTASAIANENETLSAASTSIQQAQERRKLVATLSAQKAEEGAAGLGAGGSSFYLMRASTEQGGLAQGVLGLQGSINENAYAQQAAADQGLAAGAVGAQSAANSAAKSAKSGGAMGAIGGVLKAATSIFSFL